MFRNLSFTLISLLIVTSVMLLGCKSADQTQINNEVPPSTAIVDTTITLDDRSYDLLELEGLTELSFKTYWPIDAEISETDIEPILNSLLAINNALNDYLNLSLSSFKNKSIVIMDGPFMCIDPLANTDLHLLCNVQHEIHQTNVGKFHEIQTEYEHLLDNGIIKNQIQLGSTLLRMHLSWNIEFLLV